MRGCREVSGNLTRESETTWHSCKRMSHFLLQSHEHELAGLRKMGTGPVGQVLDAKIAMPLYWLKDVRVHQMFCGVLVDSKMSIEYVYWAGYIRKILEVCPRKLLMVQETSETSDFEMELYFHELVFLEECIRK